MGEGHVLEFGTHNDLLAADVDYYRPTGRGWEERLGVRWQELRRIIRGR